MGANWCCHCGYMLPLGRKNARRCSECDITCHANCAHLVPDFCGMSMETANQLLRDWRDINRARGSRPAARIPPQPSSQVHSPPTHPPSLPQADATITQGVERLRLSGSADVVSPGPGDDPFARRPPAQDGFYQPSPSIPPRPPPGARVAVPPAYPNEPLLPPASYGKEDYSMSQQVGGERNCTV